MAQACTRAAGAFLFACAFAPAARVGYLVYPANLIAWASPSARRRRWRLQTRLRDQLQGSFRRRRPPSGQAVAGTVRSLEMANPVSGSKKWKRLGSTASRTRSPGFARVRASTLAQNWAAP